MNRFEYFFASNNFSLVERKIREGITKWSTVYFEKYSNGECFAIEFEGSGNEAKYKYVKKLSLNDYEAI